MDHQFSFVGGPGGAGVGSVAGTGGDGGSVNVHITSNHLYGADFLAASLLTSLPRVRYASHDSIRQDLSPPCLKGTRVAILGSIMSWLKSTDDGTPVVYWLSGLAGIGKSAIARSIVEEAQKEALLAASFFFSRADQSLSDPRCVFPTLAFQLANADRTIKAAVVKALEHDPGIADMGLLLQLKGLILDPLLMIDRNHQTILIVLDALDECQERGAEEILRYLFLHATQIPFLRILITSRPEPHISSMFDEGPNHAKTVLHDIDGSVVHQDIRLYVHTELEKIARKFRRATANWATETDINSLVERSGKLFIYAATCIRFIGDDRVRDPHRHLQIILDTRIAQQTRVIPYRQLDNLYTGILRNSLSASDPEIIVERFQAVVGSIVSLREPLPLQSLAGFVQYETEAVDATLYHLHSIIIPPRNIHEAPRIYHPSFLDFITDSRRCCFPTFIIVPIPDQERRHAIRCFELMTAFLKRDVLGISDPSFLISEVDELEQKVNDALPLEVQYACKFWASHLSRVESGDPEVVHALEKFSTYFILRWLEAMSLIGSSFSAASCIREARSWAMYSKCEATVVTILSDAERFILAHAQDIRGSPMHVYFSALAFTPHNTALYKAYFHEADSFVRVLQGVESEWPRTLGILDGHQGGINSVAFSPDGLRLASGSDDRSVRLWDATSGRLIASMKGHYDWVKSVAFSPDGLRLASGSDDQSIRLWDATSGKRIASLEGHSGYINSVAFSPDGLRLASASDDHSVCLWDAISGNQIRSLDGHSYRVASVAFSLNGLWLASGSWDCSVRLWNATSGKPVALLEGHSGYVNSVAFSPDGLRLASGSSDCFVLLWDVTLRKPIASLKGHSEKVNSVAFSSDGLQLASGSEDHSIRLWDAMSGRLIASLQSHFGHINSVSFSPDGLRLASGSWPSSVQLWDTTLDESAVSLESHSGHVTSVSFSPDGLWVASGSNDHSIRLWDATSGKSIALLQGHSGRVSSVAFSPDGSLLASGSHDFSVRVWNATLGKPISLLEGHFGYINSVAFSPDGLRLASGSSDRSIRLWDVSSGRPIASLEDHSYAVISVMFSVDGRTLISRSKNESFMWHLKSQHSYPIVAQSSATAPRSGVGPCSLTWSYRDRWLQALCVPGNHVRRIYRIPALYLPSTAVQGTSVLGQSRIAVGCRDGRVLILHIQHGPFGI